MGHQKNLSMNITAIRHLDYHICASYLWTMPCSIPSAGECDRTSRAESVYQFVVITIGIRPDGSSGGFAHVEFTEQSSAMSVVNGRLQCILEA